MTRTTWFAVLLMATVLGGGMFATSADAKDTKGCEGLADYRADMFKAGRAYLKANDDDGITTERDPLTYSSDDWASAADHALQFQRDIKAADAPEWAITWHQVKIESAGLAEQMFRSISTGGVMMSLGLTDMSDANEKAGDDAVAEIAKTCSDFPAFVHDWDALDGEIDGTPVATPTD